MKLVATQAVLARRGVVVVEPSATEPAHALVKAVDVELAALGFAMTERLRARIERVSVDRLAELLAFLRETLAAMVGAGQRHDPVYPRFPDGVPSDTTALWWKKLAVHFLQADGQPCLFCRRTSTTHVMDPCGHVVCDRCFDGAGHAACPVCGGHVDLSSPFFQPSPERPAPNERVRFKLLDLAESVEDEARRLFSSFCERAQAMSPTDVDALKAITADFGARVLPWLPQPPARIPVKENVAHVFGVLFTQCDPLAILPVAAQHLRTATDVLRLVAAASGADPSLQATARAVDVADWGTPRRWFGPNTATARLTQRVHRFRVMKLRRPLRRALLSLLEDLDGDSLVEDMLRHRSSWVWLGEHLHPHEYADRFPKVARAFAVVREKAPDGTPAPAFTTFAGRVEAAVLRKDARALTDLLASRPGELARRFDHAVRTAGDDASARAHVVAALVKHTAAFSTPVLLTLRALLPTRTSRAPVRIFWPKGTVAKGTSLPDTRPTLPADVVAPAVRAVEDELLARFGEKPAFDTALVDRALARIVVPFNERTASRGAVALPRGSRVDVDLTARAVRLFLHWCQPEDGRRTDIDLSVAFYDDGWRYRGVCSFYELTCALDGREVAKSSGDYTDAPFPDGASEFVDVDLAAARAAGVRFAVMVVNDYAGLPFSKLERGFAGLMLRDNVGGPVFDPRSVRLKFDLQGENGVYMPLVLDVRDGVMHWLDAYSKGQPEMNNVETSKNAIAKVCPEMIAYFGSGVRASMLDLALLHAAARCRRVLLRGAGPTAGTVDSFDRRPGETPLAFLARLSTAAPDEAGAGDALTTPAFAALLRGDVDLPRGSVAYALFRERVTTSIAAADLLA